MKKLRQVLPEAIGREEVLRMARAQRILRGWPEIVGEALAKRSHPDRYERGTVWVAVQGSAWAQELRMIKHDLVDRLQARAGEPGLFTDIRFGVRPLPKPEAEAPAVETVRAVVEVAGDDGDLSIREIAERRLKDWPEQKGRNVDDEGRAKP
jgi:predicted nucleic acid-binding Zn ribbon protein